MPYLSHKRLHQLGPTVKQLLCKGYVSPFAKLSIVLERHDMINDYIRMQTETLVLKYSCSCAKAILLTFRSALRDGQFNQ